jgi:hypothetical protein
MARAQEDATALLLLWRFVVGDAASHRLVLTWRVSFSVNEAPNIRGNSLSPVTFGYRSECRVYLYTAGLIAASAIAAGCLAS